MTSRARAMGLLLSLLAAGLVGCARAECTLNSECGDRARCSMNQCVSDCRQDRDCPASTPFCDLNGRCVRSLDAGVDGSMDAGMDARTDVPRDTRIDTPTPPMDMPIVTPDVPPPPPDVPVIVDVPPPPDVPVVPTGQYLDPCLVPTDCASNLCSVNAPQFCTRSCSTDAQCARGQLCSNGQCEHDDSGRNCSSGTQCRSLCVGIVGASHCSRSCNTGADCPSGFGCAQVSPSVRACVEIERPCTVANSCPSGLGFCGVGGFGCTMNCTSALDCPRTLPGQAGYTCEVRSGQRVCVPPAFVAGPDPLGATCSATGTVYCRSGVCDGTLASPICTQACSPEAGCPTGFGCFPVIDGPDVYLLCATAGSLGLGSNCSSSSQCASGLCRDGYCTRLCPDNLCPSGMTCISTGITAIGGTSVRLCSR